MFFPLFHDPVYPLGPGGPVESRGCWPLFSFSGNAITDYPRGFSPEVIQTLSRWQDSNSSLLPCQSQHFHEPSAWNSFVWTLTLWIVFPRELWLTTGAPGVLCLLLPVPTFLSCVPPLLLPCEAPVFFSLPLCGTQWFLWHGITYFQGGSSPLS